MANGTVLVASPSATARTPVAIGSRVPAWPAFWASKMRRTAPTTCVEVTPCGLSMITQPCTGWPFLRFPIVVGLREIALDARGLEDGLDLLGFGEGFVLDETQIGREFHRDRVTEFTAQEA